MCVESDAVLERVRELVTSSLQRYDVRVYLFGSHATGAAHHASDVDVAVDVVKHLPPGVLARLREALEESTIPYRVELVDLRDAGAKFRDRVLREGILWNVSASG